METTKAIKKSDNEFGMINNLFSQNTLNIGKKFESVNDDEIIRNLQIKYNPMIDWFEDSNIFAYKDKKEKKRMLNFKKKVVV